MIGIAELLLFLSPFAAFAAWRVLGPRVTPLVLSAALLAVLGVAVGGLVTALRQRAGCNEAYVPAHLEGGVVVPGHAQTKVPIPYVRADP